MQLEVFEGEEMILNMGPQHPSTHGVLRLELETDGEIVKKVTPHIGYLHRCFEKHAENVDYPGVIPYTDRMDYIASMNNSLGYALAVEKLMGIEVNERVKTIRIIMAELNRIASHLLSIGTYAMDIGSCCHCHVTSVQPSRAICGWTVAFGRRGGFSCASSHPVCPSTLIISTKNLKICFRDCFTNGNIKSVVRFILGVTCKLYLLVRRDRVICRSHWQMFVRRFLTYVLSRLRHALWPIVLGILG